MSIPMFITETLGEVKYWKEAVPVNEPEASFDYEAVPVKVTRQEYQIVNHWYIDRATVVRKVWIAC